MRKVHHTRKEYGVEIGKTHKPTIGFITSDWAWGTEPLQPNGCAWYRCVIPGVELEKRGWVCGVGLPAFGDAHGFGLFTTPGKAIHGWDIIVMKLIMHVDALNGLKVAREIGQKVVVDVDDFFDGLSPTNRAHEATDPEKFPDNNREIYAEIIKQSFAVITSSKFLFDYYSKIHNNVFLVRNSIDIDRYTNIYKQRQFRKSLRIGWVGAVPWRSNDLEILSPFIGGYIAAHQPYMKFHHSGHVQNSTPSFELLNINHRFVTLQNLCPISDYPKLLKNIDIGIVPLNLCDFNQAKSYIKGLEYAAAGVPFIASASDEYINLFDTGVGRIARTSEDWIYHFNELLDPEMRKAEAEMNREKVLELHTINARGSEWHDVMNTIMEQSFDWS